MKFQFLIQHPKRPRVVVLNFHNKKLQFLLHQLPALLYYCTQLSVGKDVYGMLWNSYGNRRMPWCLVYALKAFCRCCSRKSWTPDDPRLCTRRVSITACPFRVLKLKFGMLRFARSGRPASWLFSNILKGLAMFYVVSPCFAGNSWAILDRLQIRTYKNVPLVSVSLLDLIRWDITIFWALLGHAFKCISGRNPVILAKGKWMRRIQSYPIISNLISPNPCPNLISLNVLLHQSSQYNVTRWAHSPDCPVVEPDQLRPSSHGWAEAHPVACAWLSRWRSGAMSCDDDDNILNWIQCSCPWVC